MPPFEFDVINYWSELKLDIIKDYAKAYSTIMAKQSWCRGHFYIDAFAGAGMHISRATGEFIAGSPLNAVNTIPPFSHYYLIDLDSGRRTICDSSQRNFRMSRSLTGIAIMS
jgi:three-Cys-motif partner protein